MPLNDIDLHSLTVEEYDILLTLFGHMQAAVAWQLYLEYIRIVAIRFFDGNKTFELLDLKRHRELDKALIDIGTGKDASTINNFITMFRVYRHVKIMSYSTFIKRTVNLVSLGLACKVQKGKYTGYFISREMQLKIAHFLDKETISKLNSYEYYFKNRKCPVCSSVKKK